MHRRQQACSAGPRRAPLLRSPWYTGPTLFEQLDSTDVPPRDPLAPFRMAVIDKFKDLGTVVMGKSESGAVRKGDTLLLMPNRRVPMPMTVHIRWQNWSGPHSAAMCMRKANLHRLHMCSAQIPVMLCDGNAWIAASL